MHDTPLTKQACLERARALVARIEAGDAADAARHLDEFTRSHDIGLFRDIGRLTRELHDTLAGFRLDSRIVSLAERDIPDAKERLNYVVRMTEQAAQRTLKAVEATIPRSEQLKQRAAELRDDWSRFTDRKMQADEFRALSRRVEEFLGLIATDCSHIHGNLMEILVAQEFQDLTGQVIHRIIRLVQDVEEHLVGFIKIAQQPLPGCRASEKPVSGELEGPQVNPGSRSDVVANQDEVDQLLSSLGF